MEKHESDCGKPGRSGSLTSRCRAVSFAALVLCFCAAAIPVYSAEIDIDVSAWEVGMDEPVSVTITVRDQSPADSALTVVSVPESFSSVSSKKELVQIPLPGVTPARTVPATVFTLEWAPRSSGVHELGPFRVSVREEEIELPAVYITVRERKSSASASLSWSLPAVIPESGKTLRIRLAGRFEGEIASLRCPPGEHSLLSRADTAGAGALIGEETVLGEYDWTPLAEGMIPLPVALLEYRSLDGEVLFASSRPRTVQVVRGRKSRPDADPAVHVRAAFSDPSAPSSVPDPKTGAEAELESADPALVLFELRRAEYTTLFPGKLRSERLKLEEKLGFHDAPSVPRGGWKLPAVFASLAFAVAALTFGLLSRPGKKIRRFSVAFLCCSSLFAASAVFLYASDVRTLAVSDACDLLHVPEPGSTVIDSLSGGTAVVVIDSTGGWSCVETPSAMKGWVPSTALRIYAGERNHGVNR